MSESVNRELSKREIKKLICQFVEGAVRVQKAGCDGVELHASHGYLIQQFLSPNTNKRTDEYGGSLKNRMRFLLEIIDGIRKNCGKDFPIVVRLTVDEMYSKIGQDGKGYNLEEGLKMAKFLMIKELMPLMFHQLHMIHLTTGLNLQLLLRVGENILHAKLKSCRYSCYCCKSYSFTKAG